MSTNGRRNLWQRFVLGNELSLSPFERLQQQMEDILGNGGVLKELIYPGDGPPVPQSASVLMHYSGFLEYSERPFETTSHLKHPRLVKLGRDVWLSGMEVALLSMRKGEFSRFLLQPRYAYGDMGCPPLIPTAARVLFEIQILDFYDLGGVEELVQMTEEQNQFPFSKVMEAADTLRTCGNRCFKQSRFEKAKEHYKQASVLLGNRANVSDGERAEIRAALLPLYLNLSLAALRLDAPQKALKYANRALAMDGGDAKALYRCAQAYAELRQYGSAHACLVKARTRRPLDSDVNSLLKTITVRCKQSLDKEKQLYTKMFPGFESQQKMSSFLE
ncbi:inactive peptidyl-prolyl cis-trans isomerase FKBP6 isoform 2-T2 [Syngnathus typhle]